MPPVAGTHCPPARLSGPYSTSIYVRAADTLGLDEIKIEGMAGRGLHSFTFQLNLSRVCRRKAPYTP